MDMEEKDHGFVGGPGGGVFISLILNPFGNAAAATAAAMFKEEPIQVDEVAQRINFRSIAAKYNGKREIYK